MPQVVTNDNIMELHTTGKVAEFVPPQAAAEGAGKKPEAGPDSASGVTDKGDTQSLSQQPSDGTSNQPRGNDGKFQSPTGEKSPKDDTAAKTADEDDETENLTESVRKKIGKQVRRRKEAEEFARERDADAARERARAERLERELAEARGKSSTGQPTDGKADDDAEPKMEDFKTVGEYTKALTKYEVRQAAKAARAGQAQATEHTQRQAIVNSFVERQKTFMSEHPDYEEVLEEVDEDLPPVAMNYFVESEMGPQLAYHLAKNPSEIDRLRKLSPSRLIAELGKLEAKLAPAAEPPKGAQPQQARQSRAPAPVQPIDASSAPAVQKDPSQMTVQELRAFRRAEAMSAARR